MGSPAKNSPAYGPRTNNKKGTIECKNGKSADGGAADPEKENKSQRLFNQV